MQSLCYPYLKKTIKNYYYFLTGDKDSEKEIQSLPPMLVFANFTNERIHLFL